MEVHSLVSFGLSLYNLIKPIKEMLIELIKRLKIEIIQLNKAIMNINSY